MTTDPKKNALNREAILKLAGPKAPSGPCMPRAEGSDADADEEPGVIAVQTALLHHVVCDVARSPTAIKFVADLVSGNDRGLPGRKGDAPGPQHVQEIVDRLGMRRWDCDAHEAKQHDH